MPEACHGVGTQLEDLTAAIQQKRELIEADQEALPTALLLALQQPAEGSSSDSSRRVAFYCLTQCHTIPALEPPALRLMQHLQDNPFIFWQLREVLIISCMTVDRVLQGP